MAGPTQASAGAETGSSLKDDPTVPHRCFAVEHLLEMEARVREAQEALQRSAQEMSNFRAAIALCLHEHHGLTYQDIADQLGSVTRSRVQQLVEKGRAL